MCAAPPTARPAISREAIADFDTAIKLNPTFYQAYANRALVERRLNRDDLALRRLQQGHPDQPELRRRLCRPRQHVPPAQPDSISRSPISTSAIELDATDPRAYHNRGLIYQAQGQHAAGDRRFLQGDLARADGDRAVQRARPLLSRDRRLQGRARRLQRGRQARPQFLRGLDQSGPGAGAARRAPEGLRRLRPAPAPQCRLHAGPRGHAPHPKRQCRIGAPGANGGPRTPVSCGLAQGRLPQGGSRHRGIFIDVGVGDLAVLHEETHRPLALERLAGLARNAGPHAGRHDLIA